MAINMIAAGGTALAGATIFNEGGRTPPLAGPARFSEALFGHDALTWIAFACVPATVFVVFHTRFGLRLRACGEHPHAVERDRRGLVGAGLGRLHARHELGERIHAERGLRAQHERAGDTARHRRDVALDVVRSFTDKVRERAVGQEVVKSVTPGQMVIKIVNDVLVDTLGSDAAPIDLDAVPPVAILMVGLQGSGKTTFTHKLAHYLKTKKYKRPLMVAADVYRPAAIDQLIVLGEKIDIPVYHEKENNNNISKEEAQIHSTVKLIDHT